MTWHPSLEVAHTLRGTVPEVSGGISDLPQGEQRVSRYKEMVGRSSHAVVGDRP